MSADFASKIEENEKKEDNDNKIFKSSTDLATDRTKVLIELKKQIEIIKTLDISNEKYNLLIENYVASAETIDDLNKKETRARNAVFDAINEISALKHNEENEEKEYNSFDYNRFCKIYESTCFLLGFLINKEGISYRK